MAVKRAITEHALLTAIAAVAAESGRGSLPRATWCVSTARYNWPGSTTLPENVGQLTP